MSTFLIFDTETTGLTIKGKPFNDPAQPQIVQFGAMLLNDNKRCLHSVDIIVKPPCDIPEKAAQVHGITTELANAVGVSPLTILTLWDELIAHADKIVAHNINYDLPLIRALYVNNNRPWVTRPACCTMQSMTNICKIPGRYGYKWPTLAQAYRHIFNKDFENAHNAMGDVKATTDIFFALLNKEV